MDEGGSLKLWLKHWLGTVVVAIVAVFVIWGMLYGQEAINRLLTRESDKEASNQLEPFLAQGIPVAMSSPALLKKVSPIPSSILTPVKTPTPSPTPFLTPTPIPTSIFTPTSTPIPSPTFTPTPTLSPTPSPTPESESIVINEIAWMGTSADTNDEWIELYNPANQTVDMNGWTIKALDGTPDMTLSGSISAYGFYLLERTDDTAISDISADQIYTGAFENGGEYLELRDPSGSLKDSVDASTGWFAGDNSTKSSMERKSHNQSGSNSANWHSNNGIVKNGLDKNGNQILGTPRRINSI